MNADHPYRNMPSIAFWSQAVAREFSPQTLYTGPAPLLRASDRIISAGSCFAANIVPHLERAGFNYVRTERIDPDGDRFGYGRYSAAYGNIYTSRQFLQLIRRSNGTFSPSEDRWIANDGVYDPFRPGLPHVAEDEDEFETLTTAHLSRVKAAFENATVLIFTLGLTEAWVSAEDGAVFPACPGTIAGSFDPARHHFVNFRAHEVATDLRNAILEARQFNPGLRIILTVSPVPLVATASGGHVYTASTYSKATLRVAAEEVAATTPDVFYFPAYEIVMGPQAHQHFEADLRNVNAEGISAVMGALLPHCETPSLAKTTASLSMADMSAELGRYECEEVMTDEGRSESK